MEFDTPWNLIQKDDGIFRNMCLKSGTFPELEAAAKATTFIAWMVLDSSYLYILKSAAQGPWVLVYNSNSNGLDT